MLTRRLNASDFCNVGVDLIQNERRKKRVARARITTISTIAIPEEFTFHAIGGMAQHQWIVAGDTYLYYPGNAVDQSFSTTFSTACMVSEKERSRFVLFVHTQDAGWKTKSIDELPQYESASKMSCSLSVDEHHDLFINDEKIPTPLLHGIVERAG